MLLKSYVPNQIPYPFFSISLKFLTPKSQAEIYSETLIRIYQTSPSHITGDTNIHTHLPENLKFHLSCCTNGLRKMLLKFSVPTLAVQRGGRRVILGSIGRNAGIQKTWIENGKATERDTTNGEKKGIMHGA